MTASRPTAGDGSRQLVLLEEGPEHSVKTTSLAERRDRWLLAIFAVIVAAASLYNFLIATPRYSSESSYVVRSLGSSRERFSFLNVAASGGGADNSEAIVAYIRSRDIVDLLDRDGLLTRVFGAPDVDLFNAFPSVLAGSSREDFYRHVHRYIHPEFDRQTNITTVRVEAFTAADAREISQRIMRASEQKVNELNARARATMVEGAQRDVEEAGKSLRTVLARLNRARDEARIIDPRIDARAAAQVSSESAARLAQINIELEQARRTAPNSPMIGQLRAQRAATEAELARQSAATAGGGGGSLADRIRPYEELSAERGIAEKRLLAASLALASAKASESRSRHYIEQVTAPSLPDVARYPRGLVNLALVVLVAGALLFILRSLSDLVLDDG